MAGHNGTIAITEELQQNGQHKQVLVLNLHVW